MRTVATLLLLGLVLFIGGLFVKNCSSGWCMYIPGQKERAARDFRSCVEQGFSVVDSAPRTCNAGNKTFTEDIPENEETPLEKEKNIKVSAPTDNQEIDLPIVIKGQARVFENQLAYRITDEKAHLLAQGILVANSPDVGQYGVFEVTIASIANPVGNKGIVEVFSNSPKDGTEINKISIPVVFVDTNTQVIKVFFGSTDNNSADVCKETIAVERRIVKTQQVADRALKELLLGPTETEKHKGIFSNIKPGVKLNLVKIVNGKTTADFSKELDEGVAGSCTVTLIRKQIEDTLLQFPSVKEVIISVEGKTQEVLQP